LKKTTQVVYGEGSNRDSQASFADKQTVTKTVVTKTVVIKDGELEKELMETSQQ